MNCNEFLETESKPKNENIFTKNVDLDSLVFLIVKLSRHFPLFLGIRGESSLLQKIHTYILQIKYSDRHNILYIYFWIYVFLCLTFLSFIYQRYLLLYLFN